MQHGNNNDAVLHHNVENAIWKPMHKCATHLQVHFLIVMWIFVEAFQRFFNAKDEVFTKAPTTFLVITVGFSEIKLRLWANELFVIHVRPW